MPAFLEKLSKEIYADHRDQLGELCLVLPNRRAALFIRKYLGQLIDKTTFLPTFYSIEDFITHSTGMQIADPISLQFMLFEVHRELEKDNQRSIDEFLPYASWMLSDFNDIDMYLVDASGLFGYLGDAKALSLWNLDGSALSDMEKRYLGFFRSLGHYYEQLKIKLDEERQAFQGMAFKSMAENIQSIAAQLEWRQVIFAGFNALTASEEKIISHLLREGIARIYWDADCYYTDNKSHEAGEFLRRNFQLFGEENAHWTEDNFSSDKQINIIGIPKNTGQVKYAGEIIQGILSENPSLDNTAIVLPDEALLVPLLNSIPDKAGEFNVTMGLPLNATPLFTLFDNIIGMHHNADRYMEIRGGTERAYFARDMIKVLNHPWLQLLEKNDEDSLLAQLRKSQKIFVLDSEIPALFQSNGKRNMLSVDLFPEQYEPRSTIVSLDNLIKRLRAAFIEERNEKAKEFTMELEYLFRFQNLIRKLQGLIDTYKALDTTKTFHLIFRQLASQQRIPFYGEPLQGLQVMGMLETRTLDFDTVVILSVNEGILPASGTSNTFIPFDIKKQFRLPTYKDNNAVFAYHFYRLIQRAKNIYLLYNTEAGSLGGEEKSRFISQLVNELNVYNPGISINEQLLSVPVNKSQKETSISIIKDDAVMKLLLEEATKGFHPSSLALYINCPLQFYFSRLVKIEESEEAEETVDSRILGIVMHETLNNLLSPFKGSLLTKEIWAAIKKKLNGEVNKQFRMAVDGADFSIGKNHLILDVAIRMLNQLINKEIKWLEDGYKLELLMLEQRYGSMIKVPSGDNSMEVNISGTIDRIDKKGDITRILDYKTGFVNDRQLKPGTWEKLFSDPDYNKALQLMMYAWLYDRNQKDISGLQAGIISLRAPGNGPVRLIPPEEAELNRNLLDAFTCELSKLLTEIMDHNVPFSQTSEQQRCKYCTFQEICNRIVAGEKY